MKKILLLTASIALPLATGALAGWITAREIGGWYTTLTKPSFNPPNYIFGPVWTLLYLLMGIALYRLLRFRGAGRRRALILFFVQLLLNFLWSILFFGLHRTGWALADILLLWGAIFLLIIRLRTISRMAAWLQLPYLLWVSFATVLNIAIVQLNP